MFSINKFKNFLQLQNLSLVEISIKTNIEYSTLTRIFNGYTSNPRPETIHSLAKYFNIEVKELYDINIQKELQDINSKKLFFKYTKDVIEYLMLKTGILNTSALHKASGIPKANLDRIMSGVTESPSFSTLKGLARYFNVSMNQISAQDPLEEPISLIDIHKVFQIPLLEEQSTITKYINGSFIPIIYVSISVTRESKDGLIAFKIKDNSLLPDFDKNTTLIIDLVAIPTPAQFIVVNVENKILICEYVASDKKNTFVREAGEENISLIPNSLLCNLGVVIQEIIT